MEREIKTTIGIIIVLAIIFVSGTYAFYSEVEESKPQYETYTDWDAWEKAKEECHKEVFNFIRNNPQTCNIEDCELLRLKYDTIYWKSIVCSDDVRIKDFERVREITNKGGSQ